VPDVVVARGGLAGLTWALHLTSAAVDVRLLEAEGAVRGRVRTVCENHRDCASTPGALVPGRRAARAVLTALRGTG
jgi:uncharacterized protein with NAD-binding domain and iron-sulfur cluster